MQINVIMNGLNVSNSFTVLANNDGSFSIQGRLPAGSIFRMNDFSEQTATVTINGKPARQVICDSLSISPGGEVSITAQVLL